MRVDEFSKPSEITGDLSANDITRFLVFGFDQSLPIQHGLECKRYSSPLTLSKSYLSTTKTSLAVESPVKTSLQIRSFLEDCDE